MSEYYSYVQCLIALVKNAITGESLPFDMDFESSFDSIMRLASSHEISHLASYSLINGGVLNDEAHLKFAKKQVYDASYRDTKNGFTLELARNLLESEGIDYIPLKGTIIKNYYPECWMRSSCDIDVLIKKNDFDRSVELFKNNGFEFDGYLNYHDVSLIYDDTNLELHFSICENIRSMDSLLKNVWNHADQKTRHGYEEDHDYFVFHHIAHMAYHFLAGGCGIRPFIDLWILRKAGFFNSANVKSFCTAAKIGEFYDGVWALVDVWFGDHEHSDITSRIEKYILTGGAYGYFPNNAAAYTVRNGGKWRHIISLAFPRYGSMRVLYPVLNRAPILLPFCYIYRLFEKTIGRNSAKAKKKYRIIKDQDSKFVKEIAILMKELNLDRKRGGRV